MHHEQGARLRAAILNAWPRLTLTAFAGRMGINRVLLSYYVNGHRQPPEGFWAAAEQELNKACGVVVTERFEDLPSGGRMVVQTVRRAGAA